MKRLVLAVVAIAALGLGAGTATATAPETGDASFVMSDATCPNLPPGTTIEGTGTSTSMTNVKTDKDGVTTIINTTHTNGTATDQAGNTYVFNYSNHFRISNTGPADPVFSGEMVDSFSLAGKGPAHLSNGFRAVFTTDFATFATFDELSSRGDPLDFTTGASLCDPL